MKKIGLLIWNIIEHVIKISALTPQILLLGTFMPWRPLEVRGWRVYSVKV